MNISFQTHVIRDAASVSEISIFSSARIDRKGNRATAAATQKPVWSHAMMMTGLGWTGLGWAGLGMRRVRARRRAICTCTGGVHGVHPGMQLGHVCGLWHVEAHVIYQTLDAPVCLISSSLCSCHCHCIPSLTLSLSLHIPRLHSRL